MTVPYVQQVAAPSLCNRGPRGQSRGAFHYHLLPWEVTRRRTHLRYMAKYLAKTEAHVNTDDGSDDEMPGLTLQEVPVDADMLVLSASAWRLHRARMRATSPVCVVGCAHRYTSWPIEEVDRVM